MARLDLNLKQLTAANCFSYASLYWEASFYIVKQRISSFDVVHSEGVFVGFFYSG